MPSTSECARWLWFDNSSLGSNGSGVKLARERRIVSRVDIILSLQPIDQKECDTSKMPDYVCEPIKPSINKRLLTGLEPAGKTSTLSSHQFR